MIRRSLLWVGLGLPLLAGMLLFHGCRTTESPSGSEVVFAQAADPQLGFNDFAVDAARFGQEAARINQTPARFTLICGDLVNKPKEPAYQEFLRILKSFRQPVYCVPGNHDVPTATALDQYRRLIGPDHQSFTSGKLAFVLLNSDLIKRRAEPDYSWQRHWLKLELRKYAESRLPVIIVMHHPPFIRQPDEPDKYFNLPRRQRRELIELFKQNGVIAVLYGHTHKTGLAVFDGITYAGCPTTSKNFDNKPHGFSLWRYDGKKLTAETVELPAPPVK